MKAIVLSHIVTVCGEVCYISSARALALILVSMVGI